MRGIDQSGLASSGVSKRTQQSRQLSGFDLQRKESITDKACTWKGKLGTFKTKSEEENLSFDLIVSRPEERSFFETYENVLKHSEENEASKEIVEEDKIENYINDIETYLKENN